MAAGFIRRFPFFPSATLITAIEGVVIVDLPPPGNISGVSSGVVCIVGEFADMTYASQVSSGGLVTTNPQPVEVFSAQDMVNKVGGWDETLGEFGVTMGNGFVAVRNKKYARLILAPVDILTPLAGTQGTVRLWRHLPTNQSATVAQPFVPVSAATVPAGREFKNAGHRVRLAQQAQFTDDIAYAQGTDGSTTAAAAAATQTFSSASGAFTTIQRTDGLTGVQVGDLLVLGVIGDATYGANAATYRVTAITDATDIVVEALDGTNFAFTTLGSQPWRIHPVQAGDTSGMAGVHVALSGATGFQLRARPLDQTVATGSALAPTVVPATDTATSWDPLSGLTGKVHPTQALTYDALVHAPNVGQSSELDARYASAISALLSDAYPASDINIVISARKTATIRSTLKQHVSDASTRGLTRRTILSPAVNQLTLSTVLADADPGVGANRSDRVDYSWPATQTSIPEAVGFSIKCSDGTFTTTGILDVPADGWLAAVESNLDPERNPGQAAEPVPTVMAPVLGFARGTPKLGQPEYTQMRARGICGLRIDKVSGPIFQSGVTTSLLTGQANIFRRRMADFIQDSLAQALNQFAKLPQTQQLKDAALAEVVAFLNDLKSPNNPAASRITDFSVDDVSGNTPDLTAQGVFVIIVNVQLTPTADFIVLQTNIGEDVQIQQAA